jgi:hypothetical protein
LRIHSRNDGGAAGEFVRVIAYLDHPIIAWVMEEHLPK